MAGAEGRVPPYSMDAEEAVLGGILLNNDALFLIVDVVNSDDFYSEAYRRIFEAIKNLSSSGLPIDAVTLGNELKKKGDLEKIGGAKVLASLTDKVATVANIEYYANIVKEKALVRNMIYAAQEVVAQGFGDYGETDEFLDLAESAVFKASQQRIGAPYQHLSKLVAKNFSELQAADGRSGEITGIPSGFHDLDKKTAGFQPSDLIIIAGRPSMGKTALALNIAVNAQKEINSPVLFFSLEMSSDQITRRLLSSEGRIDANKIRTNSLEPSDWQRAISACDSLSGLEIYLDDSSPLTPLEIRAKSRRLKAEKNLGLIVVDYLQLMHSGGRRTDNREQEISEISRSLKGLAKELKVPIIALSQLNRGLEKRTDKRPILSDLRESGAIEQDADLIIFVYRDEKYNEDTDKVGIAELIIGKQRSGPTGKIEVRFAEKYTLFQNYTPVTSVQFTPGSNEFGSDNPGGFD